MNAEKPKVPPKPLRWPMMKVKITQKRTLAIMSCLRVRRLVSLIPMKDDPRNTACNVGMIAKGIAKVRPMKVSVNPAEARTVP